MGKRQSRLRPEEIEELVKATHFSAKELNRWYRGFLRDCPTGTLTREEFCRIYGEFFPFGDPEPLASLVFRSFKVGRACKEEEDKERDDSKVVGFSQFITALSAATRGSVEERLALLFRLYDSDGDGSVGREDVEVVMEAMYKMVGLLLAQQGLEKGEAEEAREDIAEKETELSLAVTTRVKEICEVFKQNGGDERVSLEQFMAAVKSDPAMSLALQHQQQLLL